MSDALIALKQTYDSYGTCAGRLFDLQTWLLKEPLHVR